MQIQESTAVPLEIPLKQTPVESVEASLDEDESVPSKTVRGHKHRDWRKPLKQSGGWIRVFPFDEVTNGQGPLGFDTKLIATQIDIKLRQARQLTLDYPRRTDEFYGTAWKKLNKLNSEVWIPPS